MASSSPTPAAADSSASPAAALRPAKGAWPVLAILCFVYVLNFLDRQLLSILAKPIQDDLGVTDGQLGLISGLYFALFYCLISIPVGWLADRTNRVRVLAFACGLWSAATVACGLSANYPQLVLARMTVGVGEAGGVPPSYAIITDYFPPGQRGTALGLFNLGPPIGQALGVAFGAAIAAAYSWRMAFILLGAVGIVTAIAVLAGVREPERGALDRAAGQAPKLQAGPAKFWPTVRMFFSTPALALVASASAATQIITYGAGNFTVLFLMREKGMTLEDVSLWYALVVAVGMGGGIFVSGRVIDKYTRRTKAAYALAPAVSLALAVPAYLAFVWAPSWPLALAFLLFPTFLNYFYLSSAVALVQEEVAPEQRVLSGALLLLVMNLIGMGVGPTFVGAVSDLVRAAHPENSLQIAFYALAPMYLVAVGLFVALARVLRREETGA
ncbi:major facilitator family transporter [Phenylobacterium zucineum HLK1]|uniref:Major facilitator family transporter n=1 Tax=Phenylobacterium zucineum (strain HLK1) TaxID=450851 RepID=B4RFK2_PHEZH|nr:MFS transporter [Phenylobacterium zucineum]ACG77083.1 major facilitator family transporter [Phenylobacterium zucineum HLK1]